MEKRYLISSDGYSESLLTDGQYRYVTVTKDKDSILKTIKYWLEDSFMEVEKDSIKIVDDKECYCT